MITTSTGDSSVDERATQESAIGEITNILTKRAAEISSIVQRNMSLDWFGQQQNQGQRRADDVTNTAAAAEATATGVIASQEEDHRFATFITQALEESNRLKKEVSEFKSKDFADNEHDAEENYRLKKIVRELKRTQLALKDQELKTEMQIAAMAKLEYVGRSQSDAVKSAKKVIIKKDMAIQSLRREKEEMAEEAQALRTTVKTLTDEIARYEDFVLSSKSLAENQSSLINENEKTIRDLEAKNAELRSKCKNDANTLKCKDALLNMQRQRMEEQENLLKIYETKFLTQGVDVLKGT